MIVNYQSARPVALVARTNRSVRGIFRQRPVAIANFVLVLTFLFAYSGWFCSFASAAERKGKGVVDEFEIAPGGDFIVVPVVIGREEYPFLVSTFRSLSVIDESLQKELELPKIEGKGDGEKERYQLRASLGSRKFDFPMGVETGNFSKVQEVLGYRLRGELGMDVWSDQVMQIDFDAGLLRLLAGPPVGAGDPIRLVQPSGQRLDVPIVNITVHGLKSRQFFVATSRGGNSIELEHKLLAEALKVEGNAELPNEKFFSRSGLQSIQTVQLGSVQLGAHRHEDVLAGSSEKNTLGLSYLSRYLVTFDFPRGKMFLKRGANYDIPDAPMRMNEIELTRNEEAISVARVSQLSVGHKMGLEAGDKLLKLNGTRSLRFSNWHIRRVFGRFDQPIVVEVQRGEKIKTFSWKPPEAE